MNKAAIDAEKPSASTLRNWKKTMANTEAKLTTRANKRKSKRQVIPKEYVANTATISFLMPYVEKNKESDTLITSALLSLGCNLLRKKGILDKKHVQFTLKEYKYIKTDQVLLNLKLPENEFDILGLFYQLCLSEGEKNKKGSYYTPPFISKKMLENFCFESKKEFLDPCCGSGSFLLSSKCKNPKWLYGIDNDYNAVLIAKINLLLNFSKKIFIPRIFNLNFLENTNLFQDKRMYEKKFDYIATNPPWGSATLLKSESFSLFFFLAFQHLSPKGIIRFLFPESILKVKAHRNIREFILRNTKLISITAYPNIFSGVTTGFVDIECTTGETEQVFDFFSNQNVQKIKISSILETNNLVFNQLSENDLRIIKKFRDLGRYTLKNSIWGLGIVTGDNKRTLLSVPSQTTEKIYTGKEINPFVLKPAQNFLHYNRDKLQQVAQEEIYRASEKLVYKFISNKLVFAYDNQGSLFLNSANILIPHIPNMHIKTVMAFLNSKLFQFFYTKLFGEVKILKGNLIELLFPKITTKDDTYIVNLVDEILKGNNNVRSKIDEHIYSLYNLSQEQIQHIEGSINGKA